MGAVRVEGSWDGVMRLIGQAHMMLHEKGIVRIQTDIRVGSRYDLLGICFVDVMMLIRGTGLTRSSHLAIR